jgi:hypothetical protein
MSNLLQVLHGFGCREASHLFGSSDRGTPQHQPIPLINWPLRSAPLMGAAADVSALAHVSKPK